MQAAASSILRVKAFVVEGLTQIERVGDGVKERLRRHVRLRRVERGRELYVVHAELACELQPLFDGAVGVAVAHLARGQLLKRRREHPDLHELRIEFFD